MPNATKEKDQENYEAIREAIENDLSQALASARRAGETNDFITGFSYALQLTTQRSINSILGTLGRALDLEDTVPDALGMLELQRYLLRLAFELRGAEVPTQTLDEIQTAAGKFLELYATIATLKGFPPELLQRIKSRLKSDEENA